MKRKYTDKAILLYLLIFLSGFSITGESGKILWSENYKLKWSDFKGLSEAGKEGANTFSSIYFSVSTDKKELKIITKCFFERKTSWVKKGEETSTLLNHEQRHFDLTEVYTRKLRKELSGIQIKENIELKSILSDTYNKYLSNCDKEQDEYDLRTDHSRNEEKQKEWDKNIDKMLKDLEEWKDTILILHLPSKTKTLN